MQRLSELTTHHSWESCSWRLCGLQRDLYNQYLGFRGHFEEVSLTYITSSLLVASVSFISISFRTSSLSQGSVQGIVISDVSLHVRKGDLSSTRRLVLFIDELAFVAHFLICKNLFGYRCRTNYFFIWMFFYTVVVRTTKNLKKG